MKFNSIVKIGTRKIGDGFPCFVIAEAGSNHNGSFSQALKLIDVAVDAKADAVKFQTFKAEKIYTKKAGHARYLKDKESIFDIIKKMEMPVEWIPRLAAYCRKKGIMFLSTPFDNDSADLLQKYIPLYKISSYEMTDFPLVKYIALKKKPLIISTGAADMNEIHLETGFTHSGTTPKLRMRRARSIARWAAAVPPLFIRANAASDEDSAPENTIFSPERAIARHVASE